MGYYNFSNVNNEEDPYAQSMQQGRSRLADAIAQRDSRQKGYLDSMQREQNLTYGDDIGRGAMLGAPFGPAGAAIGAGAGALIGGKQAYDTRRKAGQGRLSSLLGTVGDAFSSRGAGALLGSPSTAGAAAALGGQYQEYQRENSAGNVGMPTPQEVSPLSLNGGSDRQLKLDPEILAMLQAMRQRGQ